MRLHIDIGSYKLVLSPSGDGNIKFVLSDGVETCGEAQEDADELVRGVELIAGQAYGGYNS